MKNLEKIFVFTLLISLLISFYFFISHMVLRENNHSKIFTTWQFPMLLALLFDVYIIEC